MSTSLWENIRREDDLTRRVCAVVFKKDLVVVENELSAHLTDKRLSSSITKAWDEWEIYEQSAFEEMGITGPSQTGMIGPNDNLSYEQKMNLLSVQLELEKYRSINGSNVSNATTAAGRPDTDAAAGRPDTDDVTENMIRQRMSTHLGSQQLAFAWSSAQKTNAQKLHAMIEAGVLVGKEVAMKKMLEEKGIRGVKAPQDVIDDINNNACNDEGDAQARWGYAARKYKPKKIRRLKFVSQPIPDAPTQQDPHQNKNQRVEDARCRSAKYFQQTMERRLDEGCDESHEETSEYSCESSDDESKDVDFGDAEEVKKIDDTHSKKLKTGDPVTDGDMPDVTIWVGNDVLFYVEIKSEENGTGLVQIFRYGLHSEDVKRLLQKADSRGIRVWCIVLLVRGSSGYQIGTVKMIRNQVVFEATPRYYIHPSKPTGISMGDVFWSLVRASRRSHGWFDHVGDYKLLGCVGMGGECVAIQARHNGNLVVVKFYRKKKYFKNAKRGAQILEDLGIMIETTEGHCFDCPIEEQFNEDRLCSFWRFHAFDYVVASLSLWIQLAMELSAVHDQKVIHGDISPNNIVYDCEHKRLRLTDLGSVMNLEMNGSRRSVMTTSLYAPDGQPENKLWDQIMLVRSMEFVLAKSRGRVIKDKSEFSEHCHFDEPLSMDQLVTKMKAVHVKEQARKDKSPVSTFTDLHGASASTSLSPRKQKKAPKPKKSPSKRGKPKKSPPKRLKPKKEQLETEYEVEEIVDSKVDDDDEKTYYQVKWAGYPTSENTWEPEENCVNSQELILDFEKSQNRRRNCQAQKRKNEPSSVKRRKRAREETGKHRSSKRVKLNLPEKERVEEKKKPNQPAKKKALKRKLEKAAEPPAKRQRTEEPLPPRR